jgi:high-affinity K+ transport system ATPase subunit B
VIQPGQAKHPFTVLDWNWKKRGRWKRAPTAHTGIAISALIFNAIIIVALIPLALKGVRFRPLSPAEILARNLVIYGLGGILLPFMGIKLIDMIITTIGLA